MAGSLTSDPVDPRGAAADIAGLEWTTGRGRGRGRRVAADARIGSPTWDPGGAPVRRPRRRPGRRRRHAPAPGRAGRRQGDDRSPRSGRCSPRLRPGSTANGSPWSPAAQDEPATIVVDTANGKIAKGPAGERRLATSGDGKRDRHLGRAGRAGRPALVEGLAGRRRDVDRARSRSPTASADAISLALDATGRPARDRVARRGRDAAVRRPRRHGRLAPGLESARSPGRPPPRSPGSGSERDARSASPGQEVGTGWPAEKIETCASSGSMTPMTFCRVRRWTHEPQLSK